MDKLATITKVEVMPTRTAGESILRIVFDDDEAGALRLWLPKGATANYLVAVLEQAYSELKDSLGDTSGICYCPMCDQLKP